MDETTVGQPARPERAGKAAPGRARQRPQQSRGGNCASPGCGCQYGHPDRDPKPQRATTG